MRLTNEERRNDFLKSFKEKYPDFSILEFTQVGKPIRFSDSNGTIYRVNQANKSLKIKKLSISMIEDKISYIQSKLNEKFGYLKLLKFHGMKSHAIVKDENGFIYSVQCYDLLQGHPPSIQTCTEKENLFRFKANLKHDHKYEYPDFIYKNGKQKIDIICPIHGLFNQSIETHLYGNGCQKCKADLSSFSKKDWIEKYKNKICTFYIIELSNDVETFIKIGITSKSTKSRYRYLKNLDYKILLEVNGDSSYVCSLEKSILKNYKDFRYYNSNINVGGNTETFKIDIKDKLYEDLLLVGHPWIS